MKAAGYAATRSARRSRRGVLAPTRPVIKASPSTAAAGRVPKAVYPNEAPGRRPGASSIAGGSCRHAFSRSNSPIMNFTGHGLDAFAGMALDAGACPPTLR